VTRALAGIVINLGFVGGPAATSRATSHIPRPAERQIRSTIRISRADIKRETINFARPHAGKLNFRSLFFFK
jgi:hypothetical protein